MAEKKPPTHKSRPKVSLSPSSDNYINSDLGNAERFVDCYRDTFRYDHKRKSWLMWQGHWWAVVEESVVYRAAVKVIREGKGIAKQSHDESAYKWLHDTESGSHLNDVLHRTRNLNPITVEDSQWDKDPYLFAVANGVVELRTGTFREGKRDDFITMHSPVKYDAAAIPTVFDKFFDEIFLNRADLSRYVLKGLGYSMTGDTRERCLFLMCGKGNNGKSVLSRVVSAIIGDYAKSTPSETLSTTREEGPRNDIARLATSRFVTASETHMRRGVAEEMLKRITGKDVMVARYLRQEFFEFVPQFKLWLSCNHKPPIQGTDAAIWGRIPLIPFDAEFKDKNEDKELDAKLDAELPGILNRLIEGCLLWQKEGLQLPECVRAASADYRSESNPIAPFLDTCCECDQSEDADWGDEWAVSKGDLFDAYVTYCGKMRIKPDVKNTFGSNVTAAGFKDDRNKLGRWWKGIKMLEK